MGGLREGFDNFQVANLVCMRCMGADTWKKSFLRQVGSITYFKLYNPIMKKLHPSCGEV